VTATGQIAVMVLLAFSVLYSSRDTELAALPVLLAKSFRSRRYGRTTCFCVDFGCRSMGGLRYPKLLDPPWSAGEHRLLALADMRHSPYSMRHSHMARAGQVGTGKWLECSVARLRFAAGILGSHEPVGSLWSVGPPPWRLALRGFGPCQWACMLGDWLPFTTERQLTPKPGHSSPYPWQWCF